MLQTQQCLWLFPEETPLVKSLLLTNELKPLCLLFFPRTLCCLQGGNLHGSEPRAAEEGAAPAEGQHVSWWPEAWWGGSQPVAEMSCLLSCRSLMEQLHKLQALVRELTATDTTARCLHPAWQAARGRQEEAVLERLNTEPEGTSLQGSLNPSWGEGQSLPVPDLRYAFNTSSSSSDPAAAAGSELGPPQPQGAALLQPPLALGGAGAMESQEAGVGGAQHQRLYPAAAPHQGDVPLAPCFLPAGVRPGAPQSCVGRGSVRAQAFKSSPGGW